jgi:hypothetical protein
LPIGLDHGCAAKTWANGSAAEDGGAHRLDGERCEEDPLARAQDGKPEPDED